MRPARIVLLDASREEPYERFVLSDPESLLYASGAYRRLLRELLGAEERYLLALDSADRIVGALPAFLRRVPGKGAVLNSLPFFGSHGGVVGAADADTAAALLEAYSALADAEGALAATVVTSPFERHPGLYERLARFTLRDERIGQVTDLPDAAQQLPDALFAGFDAKLRNTLRRAARSGLHVRAGFEPEGADFLADCHTAAIAARGSFPKPAAFFRLLPRHFPPGEGCELYTARVSGGRLVAALLVLRYNFTVEYFIPAILPAGRALNAMNLLIQTAMEDAVRRGFRRWNWGGTWRSQTGVHLFKKRWGTRDLPYRYYTRVLDEGVLDRSEEELLAAFPYFYVVPFHALRAGAPRG